jgi:tetratricopeptide (TPR) repeat protein
LVAEAPDSAEYRLLHALALHRSGRSGAAAEWIDGVIAEAAPDGPEAATARQLRGLIHMSEGDWERAAAVFGGGPATDGRGKALAAEAYAEAAAAHEAEGRFPEALAAFDAALGMAPADPAKQREELRLARARLLGNRGRLEEAAADLQAVTGRNPEHLEGTVMLASLYAALERWEPLDGLLPRITAEPGLRDIALYLEGRSALARDRVGTARVRFEEALDRTGGTESRLRPALLFYRGACLRRLRRAGEGDGEILAALEGGFTPETTTEFQLAAGALLRSGDPGRATALLTPRLLGVDDAPAGLWALLGRAHEAAGEDALALSAYSEGIRRAPGEAECLALRAGLLRSLGDLEGAATDYAAAREADPDKPAYAYALGLTLLQLGRIPESADALGAASAGLPKNTGAALLHGLVALCLDRHAAARASLQRYHASLGAAPGNESALLLAYCLDLADDPAAALGRFDSALDARPPSDDSGLRLYRDYFAGRLGRAALLDTAGRAEDPGDAAERVAEAAFWMAQHEGLSGRAEAARSLLTIAAETGDPDQPETRLAAWQLENH